VGGGAAQGVALPGGQGEDVPEVVVAANHEVGGRTGGHGWRWGVGFGGGQGGSWGFCFSPHGYQVTSCVGEGKPFQEGVDQPPIAEGAPLRPARWGTISPQPAPRGRPMRRRDAPGGRSCAVASRSSPRVRNWPASSGWTCPNCPRATT